MSSIPTNVAERLSTLSRQMRVTALHNEVQATARNFANLGAAELESATTRYSAAKQVLLRRLVEAVEQCDLASAEEHLQLALSFAARAKGCEQATQQLPQAA